MAEAGDNRSGRSVEDVTDATGRQMVDDIFEESRMRRLPLDRDVQPDELTSMALPSDPFVGFHRAGDGGPDGETLVVASAAQQRRYLLKRFDRGRSFRVWQLTPVEGEKLRLLNVYRVMLGQPVSGTE